MPSSFTLTQLFIYISILFVAELVYFKIADRFNIIDKPNERSSHVQPTLRGGGIIFLLPAFLLLFSNQTLNIFLGMATLTAGFISFIDDVRTLNNGVRIVFHIAACCLVLYPVMPFINHLWLAAITLIVVVGIVNAFNFMDGINGITAAYSLTIMLSVYLGTEHEAVRQLLYMLAPAVFVFAWFNFRKRARCFAGDVGSVSLSILLTGVILFLIFSTGQYGYILFLLMYGVDTIITIVERLIRKENIFKAHRSHLYQLLVNEYRIPQLSVSMGYACIQFAINFILIKTNFVPSSCLLVTMLTGMLYIGIKTSLKKRLQHKF